MFFNNYVYDSKRPCFPDPKLRVNQTTTASFTPVTTNRTWMPSARQSGLFASKCTDVAFLFSLDLF